MELDPRKFTEAGTDNLLGALVVDSVMEIWHQQRRVPPGTGLELQTWGNQMER